MQLKTILNRVHPVKGFVYEAAKWVMLLAAAIRGPESAGVASF
jgi:hypothetical protein